MMSDFMLQSFFDGWDVTKKKDKTKGRHDSLLSRKYSGFARNTTVMLSLLGSVSPGNSAP